MKLTYQDAIKYAMKSGKPKREIKLLQEANLKYKMFGSCVRGQSGSSELDCDENLDENNKWLYNYYIYEMWKKYFNDPYENWDKIVEYNKKTLFTDIYGEKYDDDNNINEAKEQCSKDISRMPIIINNEKMHYTEGVDTDFLLQNYHEITHNNENVNNDIIHFCSQLLNIHFYLEIREIITKRFNLDPAIWLIYNNIYNGFLLDKEKIERRSIYPIMLLPHIGLEISENIENFDKKFLDKNEHFKRFDQNEPLMYVGTQIVNYFDDDTIYVTYSFNSDLTEFAHFSEGEDIMDIMKKWETIKEKMY